MFSLLLSLFLLISPLQEDTCDKLLEQAEAIEEDYPELHERATKARTCYGTLEHYGGQRAAYLEAFALRRMGEQEAALDIYNEAIPYLDVSADSSFTRRYFINRGYVRYMTGRLVGAASDYSRVLDFAEGLPARDQAHFARNAAIVYQRIEDMTAAHKLFDRTKSFLEEVDPDRSRYPEDWLNILVNMADIHLLQGEPHRALTYLDQATSLHEDAEDPLVHNLFSYLGQAYSATGQPERALANFEQHLSLAEDAGNRHQIFWGLSRIGGMYRLEGNYEEALRYLEQAEARLDDALHDDYWRRLFVRMAITYEQQGAWDEAGTYYERAVEVAERYRASLRATDWYEATFHRQAQAYHGLVRIYMLQGKPRKAFEALEFARARQLHDLRMQSQVVRGMEPDAQQRFDSLTDELTEARTALSADTITNRERTELTQRVTQLSDERSRLAELPPFQAPNTEEIQGALGPDQVVLSYAIQSLDGADDLAPKVFALTSDTLVVRPIPTSTDSLEVLLEEAHPAFVSSEDDLRAGRTGFSLPALHRLHQALIEPVNDLLRPEDHLTIIPDAPLFRLPFSALISEEPTSTDYSVARYLVHDHPVSHLTASSLLLDPPAESSHDLQVSIFGQSDYRGGQPMSVPGIGDVSLGDLPAVVNESNTLQKMFSGTALFMNEDATVETFFAHAPVSRVVHVAAHAFARENNSVIALGSKQDGSDEQLLHLHELRERPLSADLVVLSSCNTAIGSVSQTDGILSLQHAFSAAGAQSTLSTLWTADDEATSQLIITFYDQLQKGASKADALRTAQQTFLEDAPAYAASPYFWAAPVLYGDVSPLVMAGSDRHVAWLIGGGLLVIFLGIGFIVRRRFFSG